MVHSSSIPVMEIGVVRDRRAITSLEYAMVAALLAVIVGGAAQSLGAGMAQNYGTAIGAISVVKSPLSVSGSVSQD